MLNQSSSNKNANNKKAEASYAEHRGRQKQAETSEEAMKEFAAQGNKILLRIARVAIGATVKWNRVLQMTSSNETEAGHENRESHNKVSYLSRLLA